MLDGREFSILTDHKPITFALARATDAWTPRQGCHLSYIEEYTSDIRHIPGKENVVADTMFRPPATAHFARPVRAHAAGPDRCLTAGPACAHTPLDRTAATRLDQPAPYAAGPGWSTAGAAETPPSSAAEITFSVMVAVQLHCGETQDASKSTSLQVVLYSNRILLCEKSADLYVISTRVLL
jgi:hypothetical protein